LAPPEWFVAFACGGTTYDAMKNPRSIKNSMAAMVAEAGTVMTQAATIFIRAERLTRSRF